MPAASHHPRRLSGGAKSPAWRRFAFRQAPLLGAAVRPCRVLQVPLLRRAAAQDGRDHPSRPRSPTEATARPRVSTSVARSMVRPSLLEADRLQETIDLLAEVD